MADTVSIISLVVSSVALVLLLILTIFVTVKLVAWSNMIDDMSLQRVFKMARGA